VNVQVLEEATADLADGLRFYERQARYDGYWQGETAEMKSGVHKE